MNYRSGLDLLGMNRARDLFASSVQTGGFTNNFRLVCRRDSYAFFDDPESFDKTWTDLLVWQVFKYTKPLAEACGSLCVASSS